MTLWVLLLYISFIIKCEWEYVSGIWGPLPKIVNVKGDKYLGTNGMKISDKFSGRSIILFALFFGCVFTCSF